jgi:hypothetical protein
VGLPTATTAGVSNSFTVIIRNRNGTVDTGYTGTIHFTSGDRLAALPADYRFTAADAGKHTFTAALHHAGVYSLTATDTKVRALSSTRPGIHVSPAAFSTLSFLLPTSFTAGVAQTFSVVARDAFGNPVPDYRGTVHFTSTDPRVILPADYTFTAADAGIHTFTITLYTAGFQYISVTDTAIGSRSTVTMMRNVHAAAAKSVVVSGFPSSTTAGVGHTFVVTFYDAYGNIATGYTGTIHFTSSDPLALLPADYTFTTKDRGRHTFSARLKTTGTQSITATDTTNANLTATESGIVVS